MKQLREKEGKTESEWLLVLLIFTLSGFSIVSYDLLCSVWRSFVPFLREWDGTERMRWQV